MKRISVAICCTIVLISAGLAAAVHAADTMAPAASVNTSAATAQLAPIGNLIGVTYTSPAGQPAGPTQNALIQRGEYLTIAGDCASCHDVAGQPMFSGGYAVDTPVGTIYSPNITSSKQYGIGNWTDAQFYASLHSGIRPGHSLLVFPAYLFPVMPYSSYSKLTYQDVMAIKAYLESIPPVDTPNRPMTVPFPFNIRAGQLALRIFNFHPRPVQYDSSWNASQRNGAYLAQALGHCSECHTPRNLLLASDNTRYFAGGQIISQSWYAPNISNSKQHGIGAWDDASLTAYLHDGGDLVHGAPFGPMQEVVNDSLSRLPTSDVQDLVAYLRTVGPQDPAAVTVSDAASPSEGAVVYANNCARCHGVNGAGVSNNFPNLAHNDAISDGKPSDVISMLLGGFWPWHQNQSAMPAFNNTLSDEQIAAVTNYVRTSWGNTGAANATGDAVAKLRGVTVQEVALDAGTMQAVLRNGATATQVNNINGTFELEGNRVTCQISADLAADNTSAPIHIGGACDNSGYTLEGSATTAGKTTPVTLALNDITTHGAVTGVTLDGPLADGNVLHAHINFVTPNE